MTEFERDLMGACAFGTFLWAVLLAAATATRLFI